ncbi:osteocrin [Brienomyrus brachyistius]|uniref:osteocrin n=1 Tax=Brienomyrus brachyistius TaxID=42636 RepID=UPI0020B4229B|nr:osteocrin [Brienomyrus brachyistius]
MWHCGYILVPCLFTVTLFSCSATGFQVLPEKSEVRPRNVERNPHLGGIGTSFKRKKAEKYLGPVALKKSGSLVWSNDEKSSSTQKDKLLLLDQLVHVEKNAIEIKRKRSFPGEKMPLDRLSISTMDTKSKRKYHTGEGGKGKAVGIPRRQISVPIDRIGIGRLPSKRG